MRSETWFATDLHIGHKLLAEKRGFPAWTLAPVSINKGAVLINTAEQASSTHGA
jgi:hypothetical protein